MLKKGECYINKRDLFSYGARLQSYAVGGTQITKINGSQTMQWLPILYSTALGTRKLTLTLSFYPERSDSREKRLKSLALRRSEFEADIISRQIDIKMPDGFYFFASLNQISDVTPDGSDVLTAVYTFDSVMHGELIKETLNYSEGATTEKINVKGTAKTPCIIKSQIRGVADKDVDACRIAIATADKLLLYALTSVNDDSYDYITVNGIDKTVMMTKTDQTAFNYFDKCECISFPFLSPGINEIELAGYTSNPHRLEITYYPLYV